MVKLRPLAAILAALLVLCGCARAEAPAAKAPPEQPLEVALAAKALEQAAIIQELASSAEYGLLFSTSLEIVEVLEEIGKQPFASPEQAYLIRLDMDAVYQDLTRTLPRDNLDGMLPQLENYSPGAREVLERRLGGSLPSLLAGKNGATSLAASSIVNCSTAMPAPKDFQGQATLLLLYPGQWSVISVFLPGEEDTLLVQSMAVELSETQRFDIESGNYLLTGFLGGESLSHTRLSPEALTAAVDAAGAQRED